MTSLATEMKCDMKHPQVQDRSPDLQLLIYSNPKRYHVMCYGCPVLLSKIFREIYIHSVTRIITFIWFLLCISVSRSNVQFIWIQASIDHIAGDNILLMSLGKRSGYAQPRVHTRGGNTTTCSYVKGKYKDVLIPFMGNTTKYWYSWGEYNNVFVY